MAKDTLLRLQAEALKLSDAERAELALELVKSLDGAAEEGVAEAWDIELRARLAKIEDGTAVLHNRDELRKRMQERLGRS